MRAIETRGLRTQSATFGTPDISRFQNKHSKEHSDSHADSFLGLILDSVSYIACLSVDGIRTIQDCETVLGRRNLVPLKTCLRQLGFSSHPIRTFEYERVSMLGLLSSSEPNTLQTSPCTDLHRFNGSTALLKIPEFSFYPEK